MPVSVVCEASANVSAALRECGSCSSVGSVNNEAKIGNSPSMTSSSCITDSNNVDNLQSRLVASAKRVLLTKIEYEEVNTYNQSVLNALKSKYTVLIPGGGNLVDNNNINGCTSSTAFSNNTKNIGGCAAVADCNNALTMKRPSPNELPQPKQILFSRDNVCIGWKSVGLKWQIGVGMMNVGNTCYLNSTLQALFHVPSMANWLMTDTRHREQCDSADSGCIICAMAKTLIASQSSQSAIRPYFIYSKLKSICKHLIMGRQEDAHEFLRYLVEAMEKSYLSRFRNNKELDQYSKETTPLNQILGGYLRSTVRCLACNHVSVTFQHFQDLLLDIRKADTIEEALEAYFSRERLEDMGYKCESCKKKVSATKQFSLERAPIALCIQLKRFSMLGTKLNKQILIKPRLDLSKFISRKQPMDQLSYKLVAMVTHLGASQHCGHYTAIGLTESGSYYNYDDSYVRPISVPNVCNTNAYIMFYEMDSTPPFTKQALTFEAKENCQQRLNGCGTNSPTPQTIIGPQLPPTKLCSNSSLNFANSIVSSSGPTNGESYNINHSNKLNFNRQNTFHHSSSVNSYSNSNSKIVMQLKNVTSPIKSSASSSTTTATATATSSSQNGSCSSDNENLYNNLNVIRGHNESREITITHSKLISTAEKNKIKESATSDNEAEVTSSTQYSNCNFVGNMCSSSSKTTLPHMPKLCNTVDGNDNVPPKNYQQQRTLCSLNVKGPFKSLVPYESETDNEEIEPTSTGNTKCGKRNSTEQFKKKKASKRHSSSSSDDDDKKPANGNKVKKNVTSTICHPNIVASDADSRKIVDANGTQSKAKQSSDTIDEIFSSSKRNGNFHKNGTLLNTPTIKQKKQYQIITSSTATTMTSSDERGDNNSQQHRTNSVSLTFKRAHSTPPLPPKVKTKTGLWQVTTLNSTTACDSTPKEQAVQAIPAPKNPKNPFATKPVEPFVKRFKQNSNKARPTYNTGNGYQRNAADSTVDVLLKQSQRGYGAPILSWNGEKADIEKEISEHITEQHQRYLDKEQENEMDRGRHRKIKPPKDLLRGNNRTPGLNLFQEQETQRRWKHGVHRFHGTQLKHQFHRNKFKFHCKFRFNNKFQHSHLRNNGLNYNGRNS